MINICKPGEKEHHTFVVENKHFPEFRESVVHEVCSTYVLAREVEWSSRQFVLKMLENDEEGIGTMIHIEHLSAAFEGEEVKIESIVDSMNGNELICSFSACVGDRVIAKGETGQKIFNKKDLRQIFDGIRNNGER